MTDKDLHVHGDDCGCGHDHDHDHHHHDTVTLTLDDGSEMICPIIDIFSIDEQSYIALLHPVEETALLYRFFDYEDGTIEINSIESDDEFAKVEEYMNKLMESMEE